MRIREKLLSKPANHHAELYDTPDGPVVFRMPGFKAALELENMGDEDRIIALLMNCVFDPVVGDDGAPVTVDGVPLIGKPVFEPADEEYLRTADHPIDGWFVELIKACGAFVRGAAAGAGVGEQSAIG